MRRKGGRARGDKPPGFRGHPQPLSPLSPSRPSIRESIEAVPLPGAPHHPPRAPGVEDGSTFPPRWDNKQALLPGQRPKEKGKGTPDRTCHLRRHELGMQGWGLPGTTSCGWGLGGQGNQDLRNVTQQSAAPCPAASLMPASVESLLHQEAPGQSLGAGLMARRAPLPRRQLSGLPPHPAPLRGPQGGWAPREGTPSLQLKEPTVCSVTRVSSPEGSAHGRWVPGVPRTTRREALLKVMQLPGQPGEEPVCLPSLPSKVPNLRLRHRSSWPTCALLWGGHLGSGRTVNPRWTRHHFDSPAPHPHPQVSSQQSQRRGFLKARQAETGQPAGCPGVRGGYGLYVPSSQSLTAGAG